MRGSFSLIIALIVSTLTIGGKATREASFGGRARSFIRVLKTIEVGKTTGRDAVAIAERFGASASVSEHTVADNI